MSYNNQNLNNFLTWATQATWYIDPISGNDSNTGVDLAHAIQTWNELRRRMRLAGGHATDGTTITITSDLQSADAMIIDWGADLNYSIHVQGTTSIVRSGSITSAPTNRNPATNTANIITDSAVSSWTSDIGITSGRMINITSGTANGRFAFITKDLGSHQARVTTYTRIEDLIEVFPSNGDTYNIVSMPFIQDYYLGPTSGFFFFKNLNFGDGNTTYYQIGPAVVTGGVQFTYCSIYSLYISQCTIYMADCCVKTPISLFTGTIELFAGYIGDIASAPTVGEVETAGELYMDLGAMTQGIRENIINDGYLRAVDMMVFDSPDAGIVVGTSGKARLTVYSGSGNATYGLGLGNSGTVFANLASCYATGTTNNVDFCGTQKTWATLVSAGYTKSATSLASIGPV